MAAEGRLFKLRCFLEGVEVDVTSATVTCGIGEPASASVVIPVADAVHDFLPRTLIHLFYFDSSYQTPADARQSSALMDLSDMASWRLLFAGEVVGYGFANMGGMRQMSLQCTDFTSYWESAKIYWGTDATKTGSTYRQSVLLGDTHIEKGANKTTSAKDIIALLMRPPVSLPGLGGLLGGVVSLLEATTGVYGNSDKSSNYKGLNDFLGQSEVRLHLTRTIAASAKDNTSRQFIDVNDFRQYFTRLSAQMRQTMSFMDLVQLFLGRIYHQWTSIAAPPYFKTGEKVDTTAITTTTVDTTGKAAAPMLASLVTVVKQVITALLTRIQSASAAGESQHLDDAVHYTASKEASGEQEPDTKGYATFNASIAATAMGAWAQDTLDQLAQELVNAAQATGDQKQIDAADQYTRGIELVGVGFQNVREVVADTALHTGDRLRSAAGTLENALNSLQLRRTSKSTDKVSNKAAEMPSRLHMVMMTPDLYMVPPPKCNVVFPDHFTRVTFSRGWLGEITRLVLHGRTKWGEETKDIYFSPHAELVAMPNYKDAEDAIAKGASFLMQHEKYTGIIPAVEALGDNDIFKKINAQEAAKLKGTAKETSRTSAQAHLRRAADYLFFAKRLAPRQMSISARFMPQLLAGLPALILDPKRSNTHLVDDRGTGVHYIGVVTRVQHTCDASGGAATDFSMDKCRTHTEVQSLFGGDDVWTGVDTELKQYRKKLRPPEGYQYTAPYMGTSDEGFTRVMEDPYAVANLHPKDGVTYTIEVHDASHDVGTVAAFDAGSLKGLTVGELDSISAAGAGDGPPGMFEQTITDPAPVPWNWSAASNVAVAVSPIDGAITLDRPNSVVSDGATLAGAPDGDKQTVVDITASGTSKVRKTFKQSFEDMTPPWFSVIYNKTMIGDEFYTPLFGCTSVLDATTVNSATQASAIASAINELGVADMTVAAAADKLARTWLTLTEMDANVSLFIDAYTARRFATMEDILGTKNVFLVQSTIDGRLPSATANIEGFHGNAYGAYKDLLDTDGVRMVPLDMIGSGVDPRAARRLRVQKYVIEATRTAESVAAAVNQTGGLGGVQSDTPTVFPASTSVG